MSKKRVTMAESALPRGRWNDEHFGAEAALVVLRRRLVIGLGNPLTLIYPLTAA